MSHVQVSHATHMNESCNTYERVMSHIWMSHVTRTKWQRPRKHVFFATCTCIYIHIPMYILYVWIWMVMALFIATYTNIKTCTYMHIVIPISRLVSMHICVCIYMCIHIYLCTYHLPIYILTFPSQDWVSMHICVCVYIYTHIYLYIYYIYIWTWIVTHIKCHRPH